MLDEYEKKVLQLEFHYEHNNKVSNQTEYASMAYLGQLVVYIH